MPEREWRPGRPTSVWLVLGGHRRGAGDPTMRRDEAGVWMARRTPGGPATLLLRQARDGLVHAQAWGPGADWVLDFVPALLGAQDDDRGFEPAHPVLHAAYRAHPGWRVSRTGLVVESLVPSIIEQKVTGQEAFGGFRRLVRRFGEPAPGPAGERGLMVQPTPQQWRAIPSWEWLQAGVDGGRSDTVVRALGHAGRLEEAAGLPLAEAYTRLRAVRGVGRWTAAEVGQRALGDADAVSVGDYHVARNIGWALLGEEIDDDRLEEVLEPWAGHRFRVQRLLELAGHLHPRRGARMAPRTHLPRRGR